MVCVINILSIFTRTSMKKKFLFVFFVLFFLENPIYSATQPVEEGVFTALGLHMRAISKRKASRMPVSLVTLEEQSLFSGEPHVLFSGVQGKLSKTSGDLESFKCSRSLLREQEKSLTAQSINQTGCILKVTEEDIEKTVRRIHDTTWNIKRLEREIPLLEVIIGRNAERLAKHITHERLLEYVQKKDPAFHARLTTELTEHLETILETLLPTS